MPAKKTSPGPKPVPDPEPTERTFDRIECENLGRALLEAQALIDRVARDSMNKYSNYAYASAEAIMAVARDALHACGLVVLADCWALKPMPDFLKLQGSSKMPGGIEDAGDFQFATCLCAVTMTLLHPATSEQRIRTITVPVHVRDGMPLDKAVAAANTLAVRYYLRNLLLIPQVDKAADVDSRDDSGYRNPRHQRRAAPPAKAAKPKPAAKGAAIIRNKIQATCCACKKCEVAVGEGFQNGDKVICQPCYEERRRERLGVPKHVRELGKCPGCEKIAFDPKGNDGSGACYACGYAGEEPQAFDPDAEAGDDQGAAAKPEEPRPAESSGDRMERLAQEARRKRDAAADQPDAQPALPVEEDEDEDEDEGGDDQPDDNPMIPNKVAGPCLGCGAHVHAQEGLQDKAADTGRVRRWCLGCAQNA